MSSESENFNTSTINYLLLNDQDCDLFSSDSESFRLTGTSTADSNVTSSQDYLSYDKFSESSGSALATFNQNANEVISFYFRTYIIIKFQISKGYVNKQIMEV